jgi:hypothetical protein
MESILKSVLSTALVYAAHYTTTHYYTRFCIGGTTLGFIKGIFTTGSPMCHVAVTVLHSTETAYTSAFSIGLTRFILDRLHVAMPGTPQQPQQPQPQQQPPSTPTPPAVMQAQYLHPPPYFTYRTRSRATTPHRR